MDRGVYEPGDEIDKAIEKLARAIAAHPRGRIHLGLIAEVIAELFCRIDVARAVYAGERRKVAAGKG